MTAYELDNLLVALAQRFSQELRFACRPPVHTEAAGSFLTPELWLQVLMHVQRISSAEADFDRVRVFGHATRVCARTKIAVLNRDFALRATLNDKRTSEQTRLRATLECAYFSVQLLQDVVQLARSHSITLCSTSVFDSDGDWNACLISFALSTGLASS